MNETTIAILMLIATILLVVVGFLSYKQGAKKTIKEDVKDAKNEASEHTAVTTKLEYISRGVDDIRLDIKAQARELTVVAERVTRVEESTKSAHKRIDDLGKEVD